MDIGSAVGRANGISENELVALPTFETSDIFSTDDKLVLRLSPIARSLHHRLASEGQSRMRSGFPDAVVSQAQRDSGLFGLVRQTGNTGVLQ